MRCRFLRKTAPKLRVKELEKDLETEINLHMATLQKLAEVKAENIELKEKLAQQEKPYTNLPPFQPFIPKVRATKELTPNEQRKRIIESAKQFWRGYYHPTITFEVDGKTRKVTAILQSDKQGVGKVFCHLKCRDDQVFNEHIFKAAICASLMRASKTAEYFLNAVQPKFAVGQIVTLTLPNWGWERFEITAYDKDGRWKVNNLLEDEQGHANEEDLTILDDTNAQY